MASSDIDGRPTQTHGPIRVTLPAAVAYDADRLKETLGVVLDKVGCGACCSGFDILLRMERDFIADEDLNVRQRSTSLDPEPDPWHGAAHQYTVALSPKVKYDIDKVFGAIDRIVADLGCKGCCSGFDILLRDELRTIAVDEQLEARRFDAAF
jgi:hypothetical protein